MSCHVGVASTSVVFSILNIVFVILLLVLYVADSEGPK